MIYLVFDSINKKIFYKSGNSIPLADSDDFTSMVDRLTLDVKIFQKTEYAYIFELEPNSNFQYKYVYFPVQNTLLSII